MQDKSKYFTFGARTWVPPQLAPAFGFDLGTVERGARQAARTLSGGARDIIENSVADIAKIWEEGNECLSAMDQIRVHITHRAIEYHSMTTRALADAGIIPARLIEAVWRFVAPELVGDPNPRLHRLTNPGGYMWGSQPRNFVEVTSSEDIDPTKRSFFFVHGKDYFADPDDALTYMYRPFEEEVKLFHPNLPPGWGCTDDDCNVYLLSYDSKLRDEHDTIIRLGFEHVLGAPVFGQAPGMFLGVLWRELEERARAAGNHLYSLLSPLPRTGHLPFFLFSHSLGCFACAHMANKIYSQNPDDYSLFRRWYCMAAALPENAFSRTGIFPYAPFIARGEPNVEVYYSFFDDVLLALYLAANGLTAMGNTGAGIPRPETNVVNVDTTLETGIVHTISDGYFSRVGARLRRDFGIPDR